MADKLHRVLSRWDGIAIAVGSTIGVGIFGTTGMVLRNAGSSTRALAVWVVLGVASLVGSFVYADLAIRVPEAGGPYAYVRCGFGRFPAFMDGWITLAAGNPALQAGGCALIGEFLASLLGWSSPSGWHARLLAMVAVVGLAALNWVGVRAGAASQRLFTSFKLIALGGFIVVALIPIHGGHANVPSEPVRFAAALTGAWYAYVGWQDGGLLAEDLRKPRRDLPVVLIGSVTIVLVTYLAVNAAILWAARGTNLAAAAKPALDIMHRLLGQTGDRVMSAVILVSMIGGTAEGFMVHPRLGFALARDRLAPRILGHVNRGGTPSAALAFHSIIIIGLLATGGFDRIASLIAFTQALQAILEAASYFSVRAKVPEAQLTPAHPLLPALFVGFNIALAAYVAVSDLAHHEWNFLYGLAVVMLAAVAYAVVRLLE
jgi:basic amino acid/polyamine antiporter, APA family